MLEVAAPEWIESQGKLTDGLDLLGLRLPVQVISGSLLNGVTTISPRIRYLSIRAWLIKAFSESGLPNDYSSIAEFAGRVESVFALGLMLANRSALYIPGSTKAGSIIDDGMDPVPIEKLIDQGGFNAYAGPSNDLFLSYNNPNYVPGLTKERGEPLAAQFDLLVRDTRFAKLLKENPQFDSVPRDVLLELGNAIQLDQIPPQEKSLLLEALIPQKPHQKDLRPLRKEINRVSFYTLLFELAKLHQRLPVEDDVFAAALQVNPSLPKSLDSVLDGYLQYRIRDLLAVVHEAVLGEVCAELGGSDGTVSGSQVIGALLAEPINDALRQVGLLTQEESFESLNFLDLVARVEAKIGNRTLVRGMYRWDSELDESRVIGLAMKNKWTAVGLQPVAWILCQCRVGSCDLSLYPELEILSRQGAARFGLQQVVLPQLQLWAAENPTLDQVIAWQLQRSVDQHLRIAWSRMFGDVTKDVAVLISDGEHWQHRGKNYVGDRTASRMTQAIGWLRQLELIAAGGITTAGEAVLQRGYQTLAAAGGDQ